MILRLQSLGSSLLCLCAVLMAACGSDNTFRLQGEVEGMGTRNLRAVYYAGGTMQQVSAPALDGKFTMQGRSKGPTVVSLFTGSGVLLANVIVAPGDQVDAHLNLSDPYAVKLTGNADSEALTKFLAANHDALKAEDAKRVNAAITEYVGKNPRRLVSALLVADYYLANADEVQPQEVITLLDAKNRPDWLLGTLRESCQLQAAADSARVVAGRFLDERDSAAWVRPQKAPLTLLCFTEASSRLRDSVRTALAQIPERFPEDSLKIVDISLDADTAQWHTSLRDLRASRLVVGRPVARPSSRQKIERLWAPGGVAHAALMPLRIPRTPYFILTDTAGRQLFRGSSTSRLSQFTPPSTQQSTPPSTLHTPR